MAYLQIYQQLGRSLLQAQQSSCVLFTLSIQVDGCPTTGTEAGIKEVIEDLTKHNFNLKIEKDLTDYISCQIKKDEHMSAQKTSETQHDYISDHGCD